MTKIDGYNTGQVSIGGWTKIDMLLAIYDKAIGCLKSAISADADSNQEVFAHELLSAQKAILAIHAGLKPDEDEVAFNIARLLHFVLTRLEASEFGDAIGILENMRSGFAAVYDKAVRLENDGEIPGMPTGDVFETTA